ncbi:MAG: hypothetical protein NTY38_27340 [Acidobacteria bacterium]|nr:hypothetical protein [Acidobacteriota bacterium]
MKCFLLIVIFASISPAQRSAEYDATVVKQTRIDLRELGYPPVDVVAPEESAITALALAPDGQVYGATSGDRSHLFVLNPQHGFVQPLGYLPQVTTVHRALVVAANGDVYIGSSLAVDVQRRGYQGYAGGHLMRYQSSARDPLQPLPDSPCKVKDLGVPVAGEGIYTLAIDRGRDVLYGLTYPQGWFFSYDVRASKFQLHGQVALASAPGELAEKDRAIGRSLAFDADGNVWMSGEDGRFLRFSRKESKLERLSLRLPSIPGREAFNRIDAWAPASDGTLFGGTSDGYLFHLDPRSLKLRNLGKPTHQPRIRGLARSTNGRLYGVSGGDHEIARFFSYDPASASYEILGSVDVNRRPYYAWQAYRIEAVLAGLDGTIYLGQAERKSKLYLYYPEP